VSIIRDSEILPPVGTGSKLRSLARFSGDLGRRGKASGDGGGSGVFCAAAGGVLKVPRDVAVVKVEVTPTASCSESGTNCGWRAKKATKP